ncbi:hypothetical protein DFH05DRAFT_1529292 [Lentinula detonsa]|uniref:Uncharacterized protein n=1 Tax=Lentinula detonsa TaxID=2804962 RepID=A0A9W8NTV2_9AGAR|nr:hypothetical protein DFH05DRAFT_1529292 [Lentinula detonsa]KAJ3984623.1 hypothetical protein F5890DRAFT_1553923 [Lentinula detonsa]
MLTQRYYLEDMRTYSALIPFVTLALTIAANAAPTAPFSNDGAYTHTAGGFDSLVVQHRPSSSSDAVPLPTSTGAASVSSGASSSTGSYTPPMGWTGNWPPPQGPPPPGEPPAAPGAPLSSRDTSHQAPPPNGGAPQLEEKPHHDGVQPHPEEKPHHDGVQPHPEEKNEGPNPHPGAPNAKPIGKMVAVKGKIGQVMRHPKVKKIAKYTGIAAAGAVVGGGVTAAALYWAGSKGSSGSSGPASEGSSGASSTTSNVDDTASTAGSATSSEGDTGSDTSASSTDTSTDTSSAPAKRAVARSMYHRRVSRWDLE